jgi:hypothetical protein
MRKRIGTMHHALVINMSTIVTGMTTPTIIIAKLIIMEQTVNMGLIIITIINITTAINITIVTGMTTITVTGAHVEEITVQVWSTERLLLKECTAEIAL